jgi:hypothetical protein
VVPNTRINGSAIHLDNFDDENEDEEQTIEYHNNDSYHYPGENNHTQMDQKDDFFANEISKIQNMFN